MKVKIILLFLAILLANTVRAQLPNVEDSVFWEISGNGLQRSSYLFGSFHLIGKSYVDSLSGVMEKFRISESFASEVKSDSSQMLKLVMAAMLKDSTLAQLLTPSIYAETQQWLSEISSYENLSVLDHINPLTIQILLSSFLQIQLYGPIDQPMDLYFEAMAKTSGKKAVGLESIDEQLHALYGGLSYKRQAEMLSNMVSNRETAKDELKRLNILYRQGNLSALQLALTDKYNEKEIKPMLVDRNLNWMTQLPGLINESPTFIVVGALHLAGESGLVHLLRTLGYSVTPISRYAE